ncbi:MAG: tRNA (adenosine(37)-N6)-threonylcarbamoyltransferase complex dimerization subunit type 1 TsaB [Bacteroidales bacterium]|nr:tRNA (adenosine(37)-N6)-threonylcarbamoyltransferase complex dimerization subunit type 1 TsaB [Bacteroidales bacterium]
MGKILNIETATRVCSVALSDNGNVVSIQESMSKNSHAEQITIFSEEVIYKAGISFSDLDAVAISKGPGSYTGLRIGVSTAKGFCYSLDIPLISIGTLPALAYGMIQKIKIEGNNPEDFLYCPMIDARRMEVYTALYNHKLEEVKKVDAEIILENSFAKWFQEGKKIIFIGDGALKCKPLLSGNQGAIFTENEFMPSATYMAPLSEEKFQKGEFEDVAYFEPFYLKDFVPGIPKIKGLEK